MKTLLPTLFTVCGFFAACSPALAQNGLVCNYWPTQECTTLGGASGWEWWAIHHPNAPDDCDTNSSTILHCNLNSYGDCTNSPTACGPLADSGEESGDKKAAPPRKKTTNATDPGSVFNHELTLPAEADNPKLFSTLGLPPGFDQARMVGSPTTYQVQIGNDTKYVTLGIFEHPHARNQKTGIGCEVKRPEEAPRDIPSHTRCIVNKRSFEGGKIVNEKSNYLKVDIDEQVYMVRVANSAEWEAQDCK
ncbi:hypothetical protein [Rubinisphaera margarita]|uniref:hypothetical protein n=1 Tax=Rubinisphaera margarita TaxID=2909586 RepID=UPI001EE93498|nr:hypothetical protein [Rubinisphaera margarita]MCG6158265.1 hypothetical protein [Rubinisphaera margarita]